jgi:HTH-type transcriptional regulator/antitoxin HigA
MAQRNIAEVFPPGVFIKEELEARGWSQAELAEIIGRLPSEISNLISGRTAISPATAKELGDAFGTSPQYWMNLESSYQLQRIKTADDTISRRARLYEGFPIREMVRRHWLEPSENIDVLEQRVMSFFQLPTLDTSVSFACAMRQGTRETTPAHVAWLCRARQLAHAVHVKPFSERSFNTGLSELKRLLPDAQEARRVPATLADAGIRFLVVEHLPATRIDGVAFWLDDKSPVIALSLRYDRIDSFWFTLAHELGHLSRRDGLEADVVIDTDLVEDSTVPERQRSAGEQAASQFAQKFLIEQSELDGFIARVGPLYTPTNVMGFANRIGVHPGIVVGQIQHREHNYTIQRRMLEKVRAVVTQSALTDGWGQSLPVLS